MTHRSGLRILVCVVVRQLVDIASCKRRTEVTHGLTKASW